MRECWNRQTGTFEVRVSSTYGFKSHFAHHENSQNFCFGCFYFAPVIDAGPISEAYLIFADVNSLITARYGENCSIEHFAHQKESSIFSIPFLFVDTK